MNEVKSSIKCSEEKKMESYDYGLFNFLHLLHQVRGPPHLVLTVREDALGGSGFWFLFQLC
jgi:hypothetical protein